MELVHLTSTNVKKIVIRNAKRENTKNVEMEFAEFPANNFLTQVAH